MFLGLPIAFAMAVVGFGGLGLMIGWDPAFSLVAQVTLETGMDYGLSVVPLFILMGNLVTYAGLSDELYAASNAWLGHRRGGLAMATAVACGGFSAVCGSSLATAATMAKVTMPSMRRYGYADSLASGVIAAGGTLGILIPPSVILVLYGVMTQQDIGKLFAAGILPGVLGILGYMGAVWVTTTIKPELGPSAEPLPMGERFRLLKGVWGILSLFALVIGGIYLGVFTPTEAAGIGASGAFAFTWLRGKLNRRMLFSVLVESTHTTAMMFFILIGAILFSNFVNIAGLPSDLSDWVQDSGLAPLAVIGIILLIYLVLGAVLESLSMILLTVPIFYPLVADLGYDLIWFGVIVVVVTEISLITPPIGLNVFVLRSVLPEVPTQTIFRGVIPFLIADVIRLAVLVLVPWLVLFIPDAMG
jgi:tripartite ATP-independent transporter DctM subunit